MPSILNNARNRLRSRDLDEDRNAGSRQSADTPSAQEKRREKAQESKQEKTAYPVFPSTAGTASSAASSRMTDPAAQKTTARIPSAAERRQEKAQESKQERPAYGTDSPLIPSAAVRAHRPGTPEAPEIYIGRTQDQIKSTDTPLKPFSLFSGDRQDNLEVFRRAVSRSQVLGENGKKAAVFLYDGTSDPGDFLEDFFRSYLMGKRGEVRGLSPAVMEDAEVKGAISSGKLDAAAVASAVKNAVSPARALTGASAGGIVGAEAAQADAQGSSGFHGGGRESSGFHGGGRQKDAGAAAAEYIEKSIDQILLGNWTDESTLLGTLGQIGLGLLDLDLPMDIRDLAYDLTHWEWSPGHLQQTLMDLVGLLPVIGSLKYADEAGTLAKNISRTDEVLDFAGDAGRYLDDILDTAGDAGRYGNELAAAAEDAGKYADDTLETAEDLGRQTDEIANATQDAGKEIDEAADAAEGAGDVFKSTPELENHIQHIDTSVPRNRGIGGAHNSKEFFKNDVKIVKAVPSEAIPGVTYYQYNIPKLGKDGWPVGEYGTKIFEKTVYDPSVIPDSEYTQRGLEAASNSYKTNGPLGSVWEGYDSQDVKWIGYGKNGKPTSFFPDVPKP